MSEERTQKSLLVCVNHRFSSSSPSCAMRGSKAVLEKLKEELSRRGYNFKIEPMMCLGQCSKGPAMRVAPGGAFFLGGKLDKMDEIVEWAIAEMAEE